MANIQVVDGIVERTEKLFREFYGDEDTAFVFTSDHGMTPIGNHGDGRQYCSVNLSSWRSSVTSLF